MSRGAHNFKPTDVTKAIEAAVKAGLSVARVEIDGAGKIVVFAGKPDDDKGDEESSADLRRLL
jgi:hypothetical protein